MKVSQLPRHVLNDPALLMEEVVRDNELYAETFLKVRDGFAPGKPIVPFVYNPVQSLFHEAVESQALSDGKIRVITLKARKMGVSTQVQGRGYKKATNESNTEAKIISHDDPSVETLFGISKLFHEAMPEQFRPMTKYQPRTELVFANPDKNATFEQGGLRSRISVTSARNVKAGRSETIHFLHMSEVAFWEKDPEKLFLSMMNAMPKSRGTEVYLESTANGPEGFFYDFWCDAMKNWGGKKSGAWKPFFLAWWQMTSYRMKPPHKFAYDKEEERLREKFGCDDEQLWWRRMILEENCLGDLRKFKQEYPSEWQEAFQSSGVTFFPFEKMIALKDAAEAYEKKTPPSKGYLERDKTGKILGLLPHGRHFRRHGGRGTRPLEDARQHRPPLGFGGGPRSVRV